jgi:hypothetical protein
MKAFTVLLVSLFLPCLGYGDSRAPDSGPVFKGKPLAFFRDMGFEFSVDDSMSKHYQKPTVEIAILIPDRCIYERRTNEFSSVQLLSKDISTGLGTYPHAGRRRIILTISESVAKTARVHFYFGNQAAGESHGPVCVLELSKILDDWKKLQKQKPNKTDR